jgi:hypothetical protein
MTLRPTDMLEIQSAIDQYERKFPRRPEPSAEVALAWRLGKREATRRLSPRADAAVASTAGKKSDAGFARQECNRLVWAWEQLHLQWNISSFSTLDSSFAEGLLPWAKAALRIGWWSMVAVATASVFFFGAVVGGFK